MKITLIETEPNLNSKITFDKKLGEGAFGVTFRITYNGDSNKYIAKVLSSPQAFEGKDVLKEALIGYELQQRLPDAIKTYFTAVYELMVCRGFEIPDKLLKNVDSVDLKEKLSGVNIFYIIIQEFISGGAKTGAEWLVDQTTGPVPGDVIRSIMFQLTLAFCYAQSILGFQHNDFKLENVMFVPNNGPERRILYQFPDGDVFQLVIPAKGVEIRVIDLGSASLYANDKEPDYIKATDTFTMGYAPYEILMYPDFYNPDNLLEARRNDADLKALFNIMINLITHRRAVDDAGSIITYEIGQTYVYTDVADETTQKILQSFNFEAPEDEEKQIQQTQTIIAETVLLKNLGVLPKKSSDFPKYVADLTDSVVTTIKKNFDVLLANFKTEIDLVHDFDSVVKDINDTFQASTGLHFVRLLAKPFAQNRLSFGVPAPFDRFSLANALYHPFFAYTYWIKDTKGESVTPISEPLDKPLAWQKDWAQAKSKPITVEIGEKYEKDLVSLLGGTPLPSFKPTKATKATADYLSSKGEFEKITTDQSANLTKDEILNIDPSWFDNIKGITVLKNIAKKLSIKGYTKMNVAQLKTNIQAFLKTQKPKGAAEAKPPPPPGPSTPPPPAPKPTPVVLRGDEPSESEGTEEAPKLKPVLTPPKYIITKAAGGTFFHDSEITTLFGRRGQPTDADLPGVDPKNTTTLFGIMQKLAYQKSYADLNLAKGTKTVIDKAKINYLTTADNILDINRWNKEVITPLKTILDRGTVKDHTGKEIALPIESFKDIAQQVALLGPDGKVPLWSDMKSQTVGTLLAPVPPNKNLTKYGSNQQSVAYAWAEALFLLGLMITEGWTENDNSYKTAYKAFQKSVGNIDGFLQAENQNRDSLILTTPISIKSYIWERAEAYLSIPLVANAYDNLELFNQTYNPKGATVIEQAEFERRLNIFETLLDRLESNNTEGSHVDFATPFQTPWRHQQGQVHDI